MSTYNLLTDEQIEASLCGQLEAERLRRNITQTELVRQAGVSVRTIRRMEKGEGVSLATFIRTMKALNLEDRLETLFPDQSISQSNVSAKRCKFASGQAALGNQASRQAIGIGVTNEAMGGLSSGDETLRLLVGYKNAGTLSFSMPPSSSAAVLKLLRS